MHRSSPACAACFTLLAVLSSTAPRRLAAACSFLRGDADASGSVTVADAIAILRFTFQRAAPPEIDCLDAADADDNGRVELTDALFVTNYLFLHGRRPPYPFPFCSLDATDGDELACDTYTGCPAAGPLDNTLEGTESVVFVVDRSRSMQDSGQLGIAKRELRRQICVLLAEVELGIVFFDETFIKLPGGGPPLPLTPENRVLAAAFVDSAVSGTFSCPREALLVVLEMLALSAGATKAVVIIGGGTDTCPGAPEAEYLEETLRAVRERNTEGVRIHTIGVLLQGSRARERFFRELAEQNGGTAILITR